MNRPAILGALLILGGLFAARNTQAAAVWAPVDAPTDEPPAPVDVPEFAPAVPVQDWPATGYASPDIEQANIDAFGIAIATAEGTIKGPNNGYDVLFGWPQAGRTFDANSATDHPRLKFPFDNKATGKTDLSSASGRYQINAPTYDDITRRYKLDKGFTPSHQEQIMQALLRDAGALNDVKAGRFEDAVRRSRGKWASLPGAGYSQPERTLAYVKTAYLNAGGTVA